MKAIKEFLMTLCYTFTIVSLVIAVSLFLSKNKAPFYDGVTVIFAISTVISGLMALTNVLYKEKNRIRHLIHIADILVPVIGYSIFSMGERLTAVDIIKTIIICIIIYGIVWGMMLFSLKEKDHELNEKIRHMKEKERLSKRR